VVSVRERDAIGDEDERLVGLVAGAAGSAYIPPP